MISFTPKEKSIPELFGLMLDAIGPRPIAFASTVNEDGTPNLAPFSFFNGVGTTPPAIMFSIVPKNNGEKKDTLKNILETK